MKKIFLYKLLEDQETELIGRFDTLKEAQEKVIEMTEEDEDTTVFDFYTDEQEYEEITDRVKSYADACKVLGIEPMNEQNMKAQGFRPDEVARRKLETITEALNEGWKPDWNNTDQYKYYPYFFVRENAKAEGTAGLSYAYTLITATSSTANLGSRLCFKTEAMSDYAAATFADLYTDFYCLPASVEKDEESGKEDKQQEAYYFKEVVLPLMEDLRVDCDLLETFVAKEFWKFPTYGDILYYK